jgi:istB domain protein ATP-binding protein
MVVDLKQLISNIVIDTDDKMHKQCKFCGKLLGIKDYMVLYENNFIENIATAYSRCNCEEANKIWKQYDEIIEKEKLKEFNLKQIDKLFKNNNLGKRQLNSTFKNYKITDKNKKAYENAKKYTNKLINGETNMGLFITGTYGVGKTYLASCIANETIKNNITVIFGTLIQLLDFIKDTYKDYNTSDKEYLDLYSSIDLLIIDDLGKEKPTEWVLEKLFLIVNNRYNNYLPIVITTNYNRNQLRERLCINKNYSIVDSIISRLYEMCCGIEIKDEDHRAK